VRVSRRAFIVSSAVAAGGVLVIGFQLHGPWHLAKTPAPGTNPFDTWVQIHPDGKITLMLAKAEMGQGVFTGLPMIFADEAEIDWNNVIVEQSLKTDGTGGSGSTTGSYTPLRRAGAVVREAMISAAAHKWSVSKESCIAQQSKVIHRISGRSFAYGELVPVARKLPLPDVEHVPLKSPSDFKLIGHAIPSLDIPDKVKGTARFGLDVRVPGMVYAVVARCPTFGGKLATYDASKALAVPGVLQVFPIEPRGFQIYTAGGVVVVAKSTWAAIQGRNVLAITWDHGSHSSETSEALHRDFQSAIAMPGKTIRNDDDVDHVFATTTKHVETTYEFPFLAHAAMEPMNTVIHLQGGKCEAWSPSQSPDWACSAIAKELGFKESQVTVHSTLMGGGFGRRYIGDYPTEAAQIARHVSGPVQLVWTREDDMTHDFYRPAVCHHFTGTLDHDGNITAWSDHIASTSLRAQWDQPEKVKPESAEIGGADNPPYPMQNFRLSYTPVDSVVPRGWWRSVEHSFNVLAVECFVDELAVAAHQDPYRFRRALLVAAQNRKPKPDDKRDYGRFLAVLDLVAQKADWGRPMQRHRGRGISCAPIYDGYHAQVAEVTVKDGNIQVDRIVAVVDCGQVVNPNGVRSQVEGAIVYGLSAVLKGEITIANGQVQQKNFNSYDIVRMPESPRIEIHLMENHLDPGGIGEAGLPLVGPAVANAVFAATGKRLRKLPLRFSEKAA